MVVRVTCRASFASHDAVRVVTCFLIGSLGSVAAAQSVEPPAKSAEAAIANSHRLTDPMPRCEPSEDGAIVVCGSDTDRHRLSPELRAIAGTEQSTKDSIPPAPYISPVTLDRLPYSWVSIGKRRSPGPEYNALFEMAKRATDPDSGVAPVPEKPEP